MVVPLKNVLEVLMWQDTLKSNVSCIYEMTDFFSLSVRALGSSFMGGYGLRVGVCQFKNNIDQCSSCVHLKSILEPNCSFRRAQVHAEELTLSCCSGCKSVSVRLWLWKYPRSKAQCKWLTPFHTFPEIGGYSKRIQVFKFLFYKDTYMRPHFWKSFLYSSLACLEMAMWQYNCYTVAYSQEYIEITLN